MPVSNKGLGVIELEDSRRYSEFIGFAVQGISRILDRRDKNGALIKGRINSPSLNGLLSHPLM